MNTDLGHLLRAHLLAAGNGPASIRTGMLRIRRWGRWLKDIPPELATTATMRAFLRDLEAGGVSAGALDQYVTALQHLYVGIYKAFAKDAFDVARPVQPPRKPCVREPDWEPAHEKQCTRCLRTLPGADFCRVARKQDGLDSWCKDCRRDYARLKPRGDPKTRREAAYRSVARHPERQRARMRVATEVRAGRMPAAKTLTCTDCPKPANAYDHANGYDKPLEVEPVCHECHGRRSRKRGEHARH